MLFVGCCSFQLKIQFDISEFQNCCFRPHWLILLLWNGSVKGRMQPGSEMLQILWSCRVHFCTDQLITSHPLYLQEDSLNPNSLFHYRFLNASTSSVTKRNRPATFLDFHSVSQWNMYFVSLSQAVCIIVFLSSSLYLCYCVSFHSIEPKKIVLQILLGRGRGFNWAQLLFSLLLLHLWNLAAVSICAPDTSFPLYLLKRALNPISKRGMTAFYPHCIVTFYIQEIGIFSWVIFFWLHKGIAWIRWFGKDWLQMHFPAIQQRRSFFSKEIQLQPDRSIYLTVTSVCVLRNLIKRECWCFPAKDTLNSMKCSQFPVIHCLLML